MTVTFESLRVFMGAAAAIIGVVQYIPYIYDIERGTTKPHAISWFIWGLPTAIIWIAQVQAGAEEGAWTTAITTIVCTIIFFLALKRGERKTAMIDWVSLVIALGSVALWSVTDNPFYAVFLATLGDVIGFIPTVRKSFSKPWDETMSTYILGGLKWTISIGALAVLTPITVMYPLALAICSFLFAGELAMRRTRLRKTV